MLIASQGQGHRQDFQGGVHDSPAKLRGHGYATCACVYYLNESGVSMGEHEKL